MTTTDLTKEAWRKVAQNAWGTKAAPLVTLGPYNAHPLINDTKHLAFTLSRYKFAAKMLRKSQKILEIGCGEGLGTLTFLSETKATITALDFDLEQLKYAQTLVPFVGGRVQFVHHNIISSPYIIEPADGMVCLDVIEHVHPSEEEVFWRNSLSCLKPTGLAVIGTPNKYAAQYASAQSNAGHINLFDPDRLTATMEKYFRHVFIFSMNDEIVHTGYNKLAHYLLVLCVDKI